MNLFGCNSNRKIVREDAGEVHKKWPTMDSTTSYDAMICVDSGTTKHSLLILLFESNSIDDTTIWNCQEITSSTRCRLVSKGYFSRAFLNCGDKHGVIYESNGDLYQLRSKDDLILFDQITVESQDQIWHHHCYRFSLKYLSNIDDIFG